MGIDLKKLPKVKIVSVLDNDKKLFAVELNSAESSIDGYAFIFTTPKELIYGKFEFNNQAEKNRGTFLPDESDDSSTLETGKEYDCIESYWGERAKLVLEDGEWVKTQFKTQDAYGQRDKKTGRLTISHPSFKPEANDKSWEIVKGAWDHEHCGICWETICDHECHSSAYYIRTKDEQCVCEKCFDKYVSKKNWDFTDLIKGKESNNTKSEKTISLREAVITGIIIDFVLLLLASMIMDGGQCFHFTFSVFGGHLAGNFIVMCRRFSRMTKGDKDFIRYGMLMLIPLSIPIAIVAACYAEWLYATLHLNTFYKFIGLEK
ncbi:MAG: hypothetical protein LLF92_01850 [Planctomycetaceae bacterium]|nr:hypothetical protein [Planctomycetaceae bacterium]